MRWLSLQAVLVCVHELGRVKNQASQDWVRISQSPVLVENDPEGRTIAGCPNTNLINIFPCRTALKVDVGYSQFIRIGGHRVCLDNVTGFTDGVPYGQFKYRVNYAGQEFVSGAM